MTATWKITQCDRLTADGLITTAHWTATAFDGDHTASTYGTCCFAADAPTIPYDQVTEQDVLGWCWAAGVDKGAVETALAAQIELQKAPVTATGVPWVTA
jgi:hypothetical protein